MIATIYKIILAYFILGAIAFYFINRKKDKQTAKHNRLKYITYFFIIHLLFFSIVYKTVLFHYISILIIIIGTAELINLFRKSGYKKKNFFGLSFFVFLAFCVGFFYFSAQSKGIILFTFIVLSIFDAFSQISGQLIGRRKIFPKISPNKTLEGLIGGAIVAILSSLLLKDITGTQAINGLFLAAGIVLFAFFGDMAASFYKRHYGAKDFSKLLPGHGGILDRFDSLIAGGTFVAAFGSIIV